MKIDQIGGFLLCLQGTVVVYHLCNRVCVWSVFLCTGSKGLTVNTLQMEVLTSIKLPNNLPCKRTELHRFCGTAGPKFVKTTERGTIIRFHASTSGIYKGFNCTAKAVRHAICLDDNKPTGRFLFLYFSSEMFENHKYFKVYRRPYTMMIKFCKRSTRQENIQDFLFQSHSW